MLSLPTEVQLDVLKCFNFNQLFSVKLTNFYFYNLIKKYEGELCFRMKFNKFFFINANYSNSSNIIEPQSGVFEFTLNARLKEKWQAAINKSIPLFLSNYEPERNFFINIERTTYIVDRKPFYLLKLPTILKNIQEMIILRCWLEQLFNCVFVDAFFDISVFNPEMILFDNDKTIPLQLNILEATLFLDNKTFKNILKFSLNHLSISKFLNINLNEVDITEQNTNILFNILIKRGNKFPKIRLGRFREINLYDCIIKVFYTYSGGHMFMDNTYLPINKIPHNKTKNESIGNKKRLSKYSVHLL